MLTKGKKIIIWFDHCLICIAKKEYTFLIQNTFWSPCIVNQLFVRICEVKSFSERVCILISVYQTAWQGGGTLFSAQSDRTCSDPPRCHHDLTWQSAESKLQLQKTHTHAPISSPAMPIPLLGTLPLSRCPPLVCTFETRKYSVKY